MALDLTAEQKELGRVNFQTAAEELTRRGFMKSLVAGAAVVPVAAGVYFGYQSIQGKPVKAALIGCGDEGGVLLGEHNPDFIEFVAACDIRPYNQKRIIEGEGEASLRKGFKRKYGKEHTDNVAKNHMHTDYKEMLQKEKDLEAVVIALPLHLHDRVAIDCMEAGKHVLCEKLMARTVTQCKKMIEVAKKTGRILSIGHQRHYSMLYAHALEVMQSGILGDVKHIRALWHRNFSWPWAPDPKQPEVADGLKQPQLRDGWTPPIYQMDYDALKDKLGTLTDHRYGYKDIYELIRWRLYQRTGGGLMAELGSHQLDACSIFLGKVHPLAVQGAGFKSFFGLGRNDRSIDDHVFVTFEFPGRNHPQGAGGKDGKKGTDEKDIVAVTYSSVSTNGFEQYGECVMGARGTMLVEGEQQVMLFKEQPPGQKAPPRGTTVSVMTVGADKAALESGGTWGGPSGAATPAAGGGPPAAVSRGYKEEMEDFAYCVRMLDGKTFDYNAKSSDGKYSQRLPRCHGEVAMADAILALTANLAMKHRTRIEFKPEWFEATSSEVPDKEVDPAKIED
jgi:predicted dehydrogenase